MWLFRGRRHSCSLRVISLVVLVAASSVRGQGDSSSPTTHDATTPTIQPTCESRTANYITHTLPQQCLTTSPSPTPSRESSVSTSSSIGSITQSTGSPIAHDEPEIDSNGNDLSTESFMSFEEWKKMMLDKAGQEPPEARSRKPRDGPYPGADFDTLGEDGEISLDFDAYSNKISEITSDTKPRQRDHHHHHHHHKKDSEVVREVSYDGGLAYVHRSKDAGKTCKERFSYSSFDAGATVLKTSPGAKNPKAILVENKDSYMLLECARDNKFFIVELSDDILVDTVVLANFEFFSSMIRQFRVSVSDRYPVKLEKWKVIGEFQARNSRDIQPFLVENPQLWARYLRIEILSHYGNEYYCPISLLRVHGTRMLDSLKEADPSDADGYVDVDGEEDGSKALPDAPEAPAATVEVIIEEEVEITEPTPPENLSVLMEQSEPIAYWDKSYFEYYLPESTCGIAESSVQPLQTNAQQEEGGGGAASAKAQPGGNATAEQNTQVTTTRTPSHSSSETTAESMPSADSASSSTKNSLGSAAADYATNVAAGSSSSPTEASKTPQSQASSTLTPPVSAKPSNTHIHKSKTSASTYLKPPSSKSPISKPASGGTQTLSRNKTTTATTSASASPTIQDSFFKQLTKRLQTLESNTTLSLQYIELQSKFLQEAISKLERRQVAKVDLFLDTLNKTVLSELREVRTQYDQIWQSTVIALETQREQSEREIVALSSRLSVLADEVVFQKRMAILQSVLLLGCLMLVVFSKGLAGTGMEALYYPTQLLGSGSRLASPLYPSTPKILSKVRQGSNSLRELIEEEPGGPRTENRNGNVMMSMEGGTSPSPLRSKECSPKPEPELRTRTPHLHPTDSSEPRRRPRPTVRAVSEAGGLDFYEPTNPGDSSLDIGYESEPAMPPNRDYFPHQGSLIGNHAKEGNAESAYTDMFTKKAERQMTSSSEGDGTEYSHRVARPPMSNVGSMRKPLPALPEDPD